MCGFYISKVRERGRMMMGKGVRRRDSYRMGGCEGREGEVRVEVGVGGGVRVLYILEFLGVFRLCWG